MRVHDLADAWIADSFLFLDFEATDDSEIEINWEGSMLMRVYKPVREISSSTAAAKIKDRSVTLGLRYLGMISWMAELYKELWRG